MAALFSGRSRPEMVTSLLGFALTPTRAPGASKASLGVTVPESVHPNL